MKVTHKISSSSKSEPGGDKAVGIPASRSSSDSFLAYWRRGNNFKWKRKTVFVEYRVNLMVVLLLWYHHYLVRSQGKVQLEHLPKEYRPPEQSVSYVCACMRACVRCTHGLQPWRIWRIRSFCEGIAEESQDSCRGGRASNGVCTSYLQVPCIHASHKHFTTAALHLVKKEGKCFLSFFVFFSFAFTASLSTIHQVLQPVSNMQCAEAL